MKMTPLAQGSGVPAASDVGIATRSPSPDRVARAKAIASGQAVPEAQPAQEQHPLQQSIKKITMRTQVSPDRPVLDSQPELNTGVELQPEVPTADVIEPTDTPPEATRQLDPERAALVKHKRALQVKERELAQREEALKAAQPQGNEDLIAKLKSSPLSVLQEHGVSYEQLTEAILSNQSGLTPEVMALREELKALKEGVDQKLSERDRLQEQQVLVQMKREADLLVSQGDQYEAIREAKAQQDVVDLIHRTWKETGEVLDVNAAADLVENQLIEDAMPFTKLKKVQSRLNPAPETPAQVVPAQRPGTKVMRTLTNRDSAIPTLDRRSRALAAFNGTLKRG